MAALKAVIIALSLLVVAIIYSDIVEDENEEETYFEESATSPSTGTGLENLMLGQLLTGDSGSFESPDFPTTDHKLDCVWLIQVDKTKNIRLVLVEFDTEMGSDFFLVHDGPSTEHPVILVHSGNSIPPPIRSTGHELLIRFVTNNKVTSRGFQANYFSVPHCFNSVYSSSGLITSSNYPSSYDCNMRCDWLISVGQSEKILMEFLDVNTEEDYDVIQIYDGDSDLAPFLNRISGDHRDEVILTTSTSNVALIRFITDKSVSKTGFAMKFTAGNPADLVQYFMKEYSNSDLTKNLYDVTENIVQMLANVTSTE
ncbi:deleted in malignant brain tumors 1 protein-like [Daphnia pulex]|uniref:deleted in malignant brain tumors 1 protein-like n=1 Tax=Daphnia pulex TaxID=6669 RepID=UPI001EDED0E7|nr:deleted in malignant brain tumors 1 protein-like [Daphnia pulex]XP_046443627.1 deleted in malignant brain tumors 1 protein-like [Daphnia pulex]